MENKGLFLLLFFGGCSLFALFIFCIWKIIDLIDNIVEKKRMRKYPQLFAMIDELDKVWNVQANLNNTEIVPRKRKIDKLTSGLMYLPREEREKVDREVETLKEEIFHYQKIYDSFQSNGKEIKSKIHDYVITNEIKWAIKKGW
jgi:mRNA-degrading endonuclease RelE of RelBE toxin-antitoxin system